MGIKGIYKEIGPGDRIALCKLAIDTLERTGRPLRIAIDFSIWQFQVQAARGGSNPAIRTLFYRLVRLLGLAIHPIFVFDGPHKPAFKRNKRSSGRGDMVSTAMAKRLIRLFGFAMHDAPGEAEAECALLEQQGVVDAVLSEDVDTIMFGCRRTLRNWSAEGKGSKTPTHVSMYEADKVAAGPSGLDREGMVLVALMSGGDYLPDGIPGCGVKVAVEAAKAGFGRDLCRLKRADRDGLDAWKQRLVHELRTNESGFFRTRHKALEIPESFPNMEVLRYYTHPVVSREAAVERLKREFPQPSNLDILGLREFVRETFDWSFRIGAVKLIRVLAPSLLVQRFLDRHGSADGQSADVERRKAQEGDLVKAITSRRVHASTDATPELRISFTPADIVKLDLDSEPVEEEGEGYGRSGIALNSDDEFENEAGEEVGDGDRAKASSVKKPFDPLQPELVWIPETLARLGIPLAVEDWEARQQAKGLRAGAKGTRKGRATKATGMPAGALDKYVKVTKKVAEGASTKPDAPPRKLVSPPQAVAQPEPPTPAKGRSSRGRQPLDARKLTSQSQDHKPHFLFLLITGNNRDGDDDDNDNNNINNYTGQHWSLEPPEHDALAHAATTERIPRNGETINLKLSRPRGRWLAAIAQRPLTLFGRVTKNVASSSKPAPASATHQQPEPIEILSDSDDEFPNLLDPKSRPLPARKTATVATGPSPNLPSRAGSPTKDPPPPSSLPLPAAAVPSAQEKPRHPASSATATAASASAWPAREGDKKKKKGEGQGTTKVFIPRTSLAGEGLFAELEVPRDEADAILEAYNGARPDADASRRTGPTAAAATRKKAFRLSEIEVLDLTGED
ncbi:hypothetical protein VTJ83DRAFT_6258 [Remersonia thermophila]|uniref:Uncharacterized protein n=1 Tax=Remersonia thermophila TaxID=72144 RepID=A0ABR4D487_9PEZI